eukprot:XP_001706432.1 Hypothetical protein GL50803_37950 [Giardia lamblia ATCC 50803]
MHASDLLLNRSQESLRIEVTRKPIGVGSSFCKPVRELCATVCDVREPKSERGSGPRDVQPAAGHAGIVERIKRVLEGLIHDDCACYCQLEIRKGCADKGKNDLHPIDLLAQEDVQRLGLSTLLLNLLLDGNLGVIVRWELSEHVPCKLKHLLFACQDHLLLPVLAASSTATVLRLHIDNGREDFPCLLITKQNISIRMEPVDLRFVDKWKAINVCTGLRNVVVLWNVIASTELKLWSQRSCRQPFFAVRLEKPPIEIISNATPVVNLSNHVSDRAVRDERPLLCSAFNNGIQPIEVVLEELDRGCEIWQAKLIGDTPAQASKLLPFNEGGMDERNAVHKRKPLWLVTRLKVVLC